MRLWRSLVSKAQFVVSVLLAFAIARVLAGLIIIAFFQRDAVAWSMEITLLLAAAALACALATLAVRRWAPPRPRRP
jgi:hypothetical protein